MLNATNYLFLVGLEEEILRPEEFGVLKKYTPSGVVLFSRNIPKDNYQKVKSLVKTLQDIAVGSSFYPFIIAVDQEGGRVSRFPFPFPNKGPAFFLENQNIDSGSLKNIYDYAFDVAQHLKEVGVNLNFAPVCDVLTNKNNIAIGDRAFSDQANKVILRAKAFLEGLKDGGVEGCLKHFPGQGAASSDTHIGTSVIIDDYKTLYERDIIVFEKLLHLAEFVMISHCIYTALDDKNPASLSEQVIEGLLRKRLKYKKIVVSDDMNMKAIEQDDQIWVEKIIQSICAGVNLILICKNIDRYVMAYERVIKEIKISKKFAQKVNQSAQLILNFRKQLVV